MSNTCQSIRIIITIVIFFSLLLVDIIKAILECCNYCIDSDKTYLIAYMTKCKFIYILVNLLSQ